MVSSFTDINVIRESGSFLQKTFCKKLPLYYISQFSTGSVFGNVIVIVVPFPTAEYTVICPPCASIIRLTTGSPNPVPPGLYVTNGSKICTSFSVSIPHPSSSTEIRTVFSSVVNVTFTIPFSSIASSAFFIKFKNASYSFVLSA